MPRAMERTMLGISLRDKIRNEEIRLKSWTSGSVSRKANGNGWGMNHDSWTAGVTHWRPRQTKRSVGKSQKRWLDDIEPIAGKRWSQTDERGLRSGKDKGGLKKKKMSTKDVNYVATRIKID